MTFPNFSFTGQAYTQGPGTTGLFWPIVSDRNPTVNDVYYGPLTFKVGQIWFNSDSETIWFLDSFSNAPSATNLTGQLQAFWIEIGTGSNFLNISGDDGIVVTPTAGNISFQGLVVANGTHAKAVFTESPSSSVENIDVQVSSAIASTNITKVGLSAFSSTDFAVDSNGFVTLVGDGLSPIQKLVTQTFAVTGTYTPTTNMQYCIVELVGGGGGGGGVSTTNSTTAAAAAGGGGAGYARKLFTAANIGASQAVTIGVGGTGGAAGDNNGSSGATTSLGALLSATGGLGGSGTTGATVSSNTAPGTSGGSGSGGDLNLTGSNSGGGHVWFNAASFAFGLSGDGGSSFWGAPPTGGSGNNNGSSGALGAGGSGATANESNGSGQSGGNGGNGFMVITEFCS
jgi:hypothetical protein